VKSCRLGVLNTHATRRRVNQYEYISKVTMYLAVCAMNIWRFLDSEDSGHLLRQYAEPAASRQPVVGLAAN
jgi:hypothetical protein